jgi:hypothetical protein
MTLRYKRPLNEFPKAGVFVMTVCPLKSRTFSLLTELLKSQAVLWRH